jgi:hypothetical protein
VGDREPVIVSPQVLAGLEIVRQEGLDNVLDVNGVVDKAYHHGYYATALWIEDNQHLYQRGVYNGFDTSPEEEEAQ